MAYSGKPYGRNPATGLFEPLSNISGMSNLYFVRVVTAAALTATYSSGAKTLTNSGANAAVSIDGVTLSASDKVLVKNQATASQNGLYTVTTVGDGATAWVLTRSADMDTSTEAEERDWFWATEGTANADNGFTLTTSGMITLDTTSLTFSRTLGSATGSGQPAHAALTDVADVGVVSAADKYHYSTAQGVWAEGTITGAGRAILDDADTATQRATLGLGSAAIEAASAFQAADAELTAIAGLTSAADKVPYFTGSGTAALADLTQGARAITALSWSAGIQVPSLTAAGTAGLLTAGSAANNLLQLDGNGKISSGVTTAIASTWSLIDYDADRDQGNGDASGNGWTETGATHGLGTDGGLKYHGITATTSVNAYINRTHGVTAADSWELEVELYPNVVSGLGYSVLLYDGTRHLFLYFSTTSIYENTLGAIGGSISLQSKWSTFTVRKIGGADGIMQFWIGPHLMGIHNYISLGADVTADNLRIGKNTTTGANTVWIRSVKLNMGLGNSLPSFRMMNTARGR